MGQVVWRAKSILTFDDQWLEEDMLAKEVLPRPLEMMVEPGDASVNYDRPS